MGKDIRNKDERNRYHGKQLWYYGDGGIHYYGTMNHGDAHGMCAHLSPSQNFYWKGFYKKGSSVGFQMVDSCLT